MPFSHGGKQRDYEVNVESRVFTFYPSQNSIKPYMALLFELVCLPKNRRGQPTVVGWGTMPCVDSSFAVINGRFRFPLLRGEYRSDYTKHEHVMETLMEDVENWLGNMYIEMFPHPREHFGRKEFTLHQEFTSHLLCLDHYPSAKENDGWPVGERKRGLSFDLTDNPEKPTETHYVSALEPRRVSFAEAIKDDNYFPYLRPPQITMFENEALTRWGIVRDAVKARIELRVQERKRLQREAIKRVEEQKHYRFAIHPQGAVLLQSPWSTQVQYSTRAILDELNLQHPTSARFWVNVFILLVMLVFQLYARSFAVIIGAFIASVPIESIEVEFYGLCVSYSIANTTALQEILFVFLNTMANFLLVTLLCATAIVLNRVAGSVPEYLSKFVFAAGWNFYLIPWVDLIIDLRRETIYGDIQRLGAYFSYHEYGAFLGYIVFVLVYFVFCSIVFVVVFLFTMRLHLNGILQDAYWRILVVNEQNFFIPQDLELSQRELYYVLERAERWRGSTGNRRKTAVYNLITTDPEFPEYRQKNMYIVIYELKCGDPNEYFRERNMKVFRQFYITHEGAILEAVEGEMPAGIASAVLNMQKGFLSFLKRGRTKGERTKGLADTAADLDAFSMAIGQHFDVKKVVASVRSPAVPSNPIVEHWPAR
jgi:hypothetical protein